jgi:hypothetical protein
VQLIGDFLSEIGVTKTLWLLDSPVSNSGRLKTLIGQLAQKNGWDGFDKDIRLSSAEALTAGWEIRLSLSPDAELIKTDLIVASSDSVILDGCTRWTNLAAEIIMQKLPSAIVIDLGPEHLLNASR